MSQALHNIAPPGSLEQKDLEHLLHPATNLKLLHEKGSETPFGSDFGGTDETIIAEAYDKPVVVLDPDGIFSPLRAQLELLVDRGFAREPAAEAVTWTRDVAAALDACERRPAPVAGSPIEYAEEVLEAEVGDD